MMIILFLIISFISIVLYLLKVNNEYWERRGVPGPKPKFVVGNMGDNFFTKKAFSEVIAEIYKEYKQNRIVGFYRASTPSLLICDPDLIKDITVKSFKHFEDNDIFVDKKSDPLFGRNPFFLKGEEWKTVRSLLTPGFTSGKMKSLYPILENISENLVNFIEREVLSKDGYEAKELCSRFTLNNVASCAFGIEGKCFEEDNSEFRDIARNFLTPEPHQAFFFLMSILFPFLSKLLPIKFVPKTVEDRITNIVTQTLEYRQKNKVVRNDYLFILNKLKETCKDFDFTDLDVAAHAAGFFIDGYETSAATMASLLYELARNPNSQEKLREEVTHAFKNNNNHLAYEILHELPYLDSALNEAMRLHPAIGTLSKTCTKSYTFLPNVIDGITKPIAIEEGTPVFISLFGMHRDSRYFENSTEFKPERFVGSNKENIKKYSFMPFGEGPRACLGQRFGVLQLKIGIAYIIKNFELTVNSKTKTPLEYNPFNFLMEVKGGLWINFKKVV